MSFETVRSIPIQLYVVALTGALLVLCLRVVGCKTQDGLSEREPTEVSQVVPAEPAPQPIPTPTPVAQPQPTEAAAQPVKPTEPKPAVAKPEPAPPCKKMTTKKEVKEEGRGNNEFVAKMYGKLRRTKGNLFISPLSIRTACAMAYGGAKNKTATQMAKALSYRFADEQLHATMCTAAHELTREQEGVSVSLANALWRQKEFAVLDSYVELNRSFYNAQQYEVDFKTATEAARQTINQKIEEQTKGKVVECIPKTGVTADTKLVLTNAIHFKGTWLTQFDATQTQTQPFFITPKKKVDVPLMAVKSRFRYREVDDLQLIELPYAGKAFSMVVILPTKPNGLKKLERSLSAEKLAEWQTSMYKRPLQLYLPKFTITWGTEDLSKQLIQLGMKDAFKSHKADFSGITGQKGLFIDGVFHKTLIEVTEQGTEAAGATAVAMRKGGPPEPPPTFRADRPFLFIIKDTITGAILFIGRLTDPTA